jgi:hypothetical protein
MTVEDGSANNGEKGNERQKEKAHINGARRRGGQSQKKIIDGIGRSIKADEGRICSWNLKWGCGV